MSIPVNPILQRGLWLQSMMQITAGLEFQRAMKGEKAPPRRLFLSPGISLWAMADTQFGEVAVFFILIL